MEILVMAFGLSMDAFAVSLCKGFALRRVRLSQAIWAGAWFGGFQALMPLLGYLLAHSCGETLERIDHWVAAVLLGALGLNMVREALLGEAEAVSGDLSFRAMGVLAIATSVDALAAGISMVAMIEPAGVPYALCTIGSVTFLLCALGLLLGARVGEKSGPKAELLGGLTLLCLGGRILADHIL